MARKNNFRLFLTIVPWGCSMQRLGLTASALAGTCAGIALPSDTIPEMDLPHDSRLVEDVVPIPVQDVCEEADAAPDFTQQIILPPQQLDLSLCKRRESDGWVSERVVFYRGDDDKWLAGGGGFIVSRRAQDVATEKELFLRYESAVRSGDVVQVALALRAFESYYGTLRLLTSGGMTGRIWAGEKLVQLENLLIETDEFEQCVVENNGGLAFDYKPVSKIPVVLNLPQYDKSEIKITHYPRSVVGELYFLPLSELGVTQTIINAMGVREYAERMQSYRHVAMKSLCTRLPGQFGPVQIFRDRVGRAHLDDGHHRARGALLASYTHILTVRIIGRITNLTSGLRLQDLHMVDDAEYQRIRAQGLNLGVGYNDV